jgi:nucleotide-binding universal stress UspA family protein
MNAQPMLIATDLGETSEVVIRAGLDLARGLGAVPLLLHVDPYGRTFKELTHAISAEELGRMRKAYREQSVKAMRDIAKLVETGDQRGEILVSEGRPYEEILSVAESRRVGTIVVGSHVRRGFERLLLGRTAIRVVRESPCAVLTVDVHRPWRGIQKVVYATDLAPGGKRAEGWAARLAGTFGAHLTVVHVAELGANLAAPYVIPESAQRAIQEALAERVEGLKLHLADRAAVHAPGATGVSARLFTAHDAAAGVVEAAREENADVVVMGTHGRKGIARALLGSVAEGVLHRATCAVLTVRE